MVSPLHIIDATSVAQPRLLPPTDKDLQLKSHRLIITFFDRFSDHSNYLIENKKEVANGNIKNAKLGPCGQQACLILPTIPVRIPLREHFN